MKDNVKERIEWVRSGEDGKAQFARFILNGCLAAGVHYGVYLILILLADWQRPAVEAVMSRETSTSVAYVVGYIVSFAVNFYFTCVFTFRASPSWARFVGFSGSHVVNFLLHIVLFWACMQVGIHRLAAPIVVMGIAMLVQFTILRFVFRKH